MIAYNQQWLDGLMARASALQWHKKSLLNDEQWQLIQDHYPAGFYTPNVFIRIGLGFFCCILIGAMQSFLWMIVLLSSDGNILLPVIGVLTVLLGISCLAGLEFVIRGRHHYASGIDDVLLYAGIGQVLTGIFLVPEGFDTMLPYFVVALPLLVAGAVRYTDRLLTFLAYICLLAIALLVVGEIPELALYLLPLTGILFSVGIYMLVKRYQQQADWRYWSGNLHILEVMSLITFYTSGNYWVVQQGAESFFELSVVPMAWFFWVFTFGVPAVYLYKGLRNKDRVMLWIGLGCVAVAVFTFRAYFQVLPMAKAASIAGAFLFTVAYFSIRYLKRGVAGYSYQPEDTQKPLFVEAETLVIAQTFGSDTQTDEPDLSFGGGKMGGGGAGGDY